MPIYEVSCVNGACPDYSEIREVLVRRFDSPLPPCPKCGSGLSREIAKPNVIWARPLSHYDKKGCQGAGMDSHIVMRKTSSKSGKPEPFVVDSFAKQREICRDECLINPMDMNPNARIDSEGREMMTVGMPGQWSNGVPVEDNSGHWIENPDWN